MKNGFSVEKSIELGQDILGQQRDDTYLAIAQDVEHSLSRQSLTAGNDTLAELAWDAFGDGCEAYDVPWTLDAFTVHFPVFAIIVGL